MAGKKGMTHYAVEVKLQAIQLHQEDGWPSAEIAMHLGIREKTRIKIWTRQYRREGVAGLTHGGSGRPHKAHSAQERIASLEMENALLKKIPYRVAQGYAREARYRVIEHYRGTYPVSGMCAFFGISRAAYSAWRNRMDQPDPDAARKQSIQAACAASKKTYGYRRIGLWLRQKRGVVINHKAVLRLMNRLGIHSIARRRKPYRKMGPWETSYQYPNVLKRDFTATRPNQKWVTDVTYIATQQGWAYLSTIQDLFGGYIVAYALSRSNWVALVTQTLQLAKDKEKVPAGRILHRDPGHPYTSHAYPVLTQPYSITPPMSRRGNCWDNAPMENFFGHLKEEALRHIQTPTFAEAKEINAEYIHLSNYERIPLKTRQTPYQVRCLSG